MYIKAGAIIEKASSKNLKDGEVEFIVSTNALDAHGERIDVNGISLKDFKKNPVVLWSHDGFNLPIAKAVRVWKSEGKLMARAKFYLNDDFPRKVYNYIKDGFLNAVSIGGMVDEWAEDGMTIAKMTMKEFSVVSVPANPEAIATAKSLDSKEKTQLQGLARSYARKVLVDGGNDEVMRNIKNLKQLVATLEEVALSETPEDRQTNKIHVVLRQTQAVDHQVEKTIKSIKLKKEIE